MPGANPAMRRLLTEWGAKNRVNVSLELLSTGTAHGKMFLAEAAEALAGAGHDVMVFEAWGVQRYHRYLEPVDDVVEALTKRYGPIDKMDAYLGTVNGHWMGLPTSVGTQYKPSCARISWFRKWGYDVRAWFPDKPGDAKTAEAWTYDLLLKLAPEAKKAGEPFALGLGQTTDSVDWTGAVLRAYGGELMDEKGSVQVRSDAVQQVLEYMVKLYPHLPAGAFAYDDTSNNKALIANRSALIFNPPSAWIVARREAVHVAEDCWTFPMPSGPKGRYDSYLPFFWGVWSFSPNKTAAKELIAWLQERAQVETLCDATLGYDIPPFQSMHDFKIWSTARPPLGTLYNYPIRPWHATEPNVAAYPAPPHIATQLYDNGTFNVMIVKLARHKEKMNSVLDWAENEINGYANM